MTRILLIGRNGQVGWELERTLAPLGTIQALDYPDVDFERPDTLRDAVRTFRPGLIVNAAAYTAVDRAESEPDKAGRINADGPALLAQEARALGAGLVHYSTDYVFDGTHRTPYQETDAPHPLGVYGRTKLAGDEAIAASGVPHLILRLAWVYGLRGQNFMLTLQRRASAGAALRVVDDQIGCPTWSRSVAHATASVLAQVTGPEARLDFGQVSGTYHCVCGGQTTWYQFARAFLSETVSVTPIPTAEYPTPARRPMYSVLDCSKLARTFGVQLPAWDEALRDCLAEQRAMPA